MLSQPKKVVMAINLDQLLNLLSKIYDATDEAKRTSGSLDVIMIQSDLIALSLLQRLNVSNSDYFRFDIYESFSKVIQSFLRSISHRSTM